MMHSVPRSCFFFCFPLPGCSQMADMAHRSVASAVLAHLWMSHVGKAVLCPASLQGNTLL